MKPVFYIGIMALAIWACSSGKQTSKAPAIVAQSSEDSTVYEIHIFDTQFDQWYLLNYNDAQDHSNAYYRAKDQIAVGNWNDYYRTNKYPLVIDTFLDYKSDIDYGIDVNRKLFWYFKFLEANYGIRLLR